MLTSDPVIINNGSYISSPPMFFRCNIQRCSNHNPIHPFDFIIYEPKPWTCLNVRNITIREEKLQVQAGRVCRADHPTYFLNLSLCLFLPKTQLASKRYYSKAQKFATTWLLVTCLLGAKVRSLQRHHRGSLYLSPRICLSNCRC